MVLLEVRRTRPGQSLSDAPYVTSSYAYAVLLGEAISSEVYVI